MAVMRVVQVSSPKGPFEIVERPIPEPGAGWVRVGRPSLAVAVVLAGATAVLVVVGFAPQLVLDALTP